MGRPLFFQTPAPAVRVESEQQDAYPTYEKWTYWNAFDPDSDEFFDSEDAVYEAVVDPAQMQEEENGRRREMLGAEDTSSSDTSSSGRNTPLDDLDGYARSAPSIEEMELANRRRAARQDALPLADTPDRSGERIAVQLLTETNRDNAVPFPASPINGPTTRSPTVLELVSRSPSPALRMSSPVFSPAQESRSPYSTSTEPISMPMPVRPSTPPNLSPLFYPSPSPPPSVSPRLYSWPHRPSHFAQPPSPTTRLSELLPTRSARLSVAHITPRLVRVHHMAR